MSSCEYANIRVWGQQRLLTNQPLPSARLVIGFRETYTPPNATEDFLTQRRGKSGTRQWSLYPDQQAVWQDCFGTDPENYASVLLRRRSHKLRLMGSLNWNTMSVYCPKRMQRAKFAWLVNAWLHLMNSKLSHNIRVDCLATHLERGRIHLVRADIQGYLDITWPESLSWPATVMTKEAWRVNIKREQRGGAHYLALWQEGLTTAVHPSGCRCMSAHSLTPSLPVMR